MSVADKGELQCGGGGNDDVGSVVAGAVAEELLVGRGLSASGSKSSVTSDNDSESSSAVVEQCSAPIEDALATLVENDVSM
jgi:hypothetical protein